MGLYTVNDLCHVYALDRTAAAGFLSLLTLLWCNRGKWIQTPQKKTAASPVWANWNIKHLCSVKWQDQAGKQTEQIRAVSVMCSSVIILYIVRNGNCVYCSFVFKCWQEMRNGNTSSHSGKNGIWKSQKITLYWVQCYVLCFYQTLLK